MTFKAWADEEPHWTCDAVIDQPATVAEILQMVAATGRARRAMRDFKHTIIRDNADAPVVQHFSPRNTWGFQAVRNFPKELHGLRIKCISERMEWQEDEVVVYTDDYDEDTATELEELQLRGVVLTDKDTERRQCLAAGPVSSGADRPAPRRVHLLRRDRSPAHQYRRQDQVRP